ncbi:MAG: hypothetical protein H0X63_03990 [Flavobacteriales bacterium]|nr:hypothetical protein [Flavobacteriales bacterium]
MTIEEIYYSEDISVRACNVCNDNGLKDLSAILNYYRENKTFNSLRNCGKKSNEELTSICLKYIYSDGIEQLELPKTENPLISLISNLTRTQREIINSFIDITFNHLSNRSKNAITSFLKSNLKIRNICDKILANEGFNILEIKNVGRKSVTELNSFFHITKNFILKVSRIENENDLIALKNRFFIEKTFSITEIPSEILESQSIFKLTDFLICQNAIFNKHYNEIFLKAFKIYESQTELTLDEIAEDCGLTRERIRQIRKIFLEELFTKLHFIKITDDDLFQKYNIDILQDYILIDSDIVNLINEINNTNFSNEFITLLIYVYISDKFELIGNIEDVLQPKFFKTKNRHNWNNFYLVNTKICNEFDFIAFADDIDNRLNERIEETYKFNYKSYLFNFLRNGDASILSIIFSIAEKIINHEFEIFIDLNDSIIFKRNTVKQVPEYAIDALEKLGIPSKIEDIYNLIEKDFPEITKSIEALRGSLQRTPEVNCFGRSSTYGLKKWEDEKEGIKGGTIKDIVLEYLKEKKDPIHVYELLNEVHKYREKTNSKNIITNLKLDPQKQFVIFNQNFIGLSSKIYNSNLTNLPKFLGKMITHFIKQYPSIEIIKVEQHFCKILEISEENTNCIIQILIQNEFINIDNKNNLYV